MPVSADTLQALIAAGVTGDALVAVVRNIDADMTVAQPANPVKSRSAGAERQARYRERLSGQVTQSDVTVTHNSDVTSVTEPPQRDKSNPPETSLRSDLDRTRGDWFAELWSILPHRKGDDKQPALQKFCRLVRDAKDAAKLASEIIEGGKRYAFAEAETDRQFIKATTVWLNRRGWESDYSDDPKARTPPRGGGSPGGGSSRGRQSGPSMADLASLNSASDLFESPSDVPRDRDPFPGSSDASDPKIRGFAGRLREQDRGDARGQVLDLRRAYGG